VNKCFVKIVRQWLHDADGILNVGLILCSAVVLYATQIITSLIVNRPNLLGSSLKSFYIMLSIEVMLLL